MKATALLFTTLAFPVFSHAQAFDVKPGLWEHSIDLKSESGRLEIALELARSQMQLLPPEQRKVVEDTLAQQGIKADFVNQTFQNCITIEEAGSGVFQFAEAGGCEQTSVHTEGSLTDISFTCAQGQGELTLINGTTYTGSSSMQLNFGGIIENATATHSGRWVGESCAALNP
jgi:hypothetical protein